MAPLRIALYVSLGLLMIDGLIEVGLVSAMVGFLHRQGFISYTYPAARGRGTQTASLNPVPLHYITQNGHLSNASGAVAFLLVGLGGILALALRNRQNFSTSKVSKIWYHSWLLLTILSFLMTTAALIYTFLVTRWALWYAFSTQLAHSAGTAQYINGYWTPEVWYSRINNRLMLDAATHDYFSKQIRIMQGWRYNLIPLFILGFVVMVLALIEAVAARRRSRQEARAYKQESIVTQYS